MLFPTLRKIWCKKKFISCFMLFSTLKKKYIEKCPFTYRLNGRWFLQIVDRDSWNLYIHYILYSRVLILYLKCGGGGGVMFFSHFMLFPTFLEKNLGIQNNYFSFNIFFVFFYAGNIEKCLFTYSYWLNGRWFLQIVDILAGNFNMKLRPNKKICVFPISRPTHHFLGDRLMFFYCATQSFFIGDHIEKKMK